jgi:hypothetical protein
VLIRDGECHRHAEQKVIFVRLQMGDGMGWMGGVAEQRGTDVLLGAANLVYAPAGPLDCSRSNPRHSLALAAVARYTFVIVLFATVTRYRLRLV